MRAIPTEHCEAEIRRLLEDEEVLTLARQLRADHSYSTRFGWAVYFDKNTGFEHPLARIAEVIRRDGDAVVPAEPVLRELTDLTYNSWRARSVAAWAISRIPLNAQDRAIAIQKLMALADRAHYGPWTGYAFRAAFRSFIALMIVPRLVSMAIVSPGVHREPRSFTAWLALTSAVTLIATLAGSFLYDRYRRGDGSRFQAMRSLARMEAVESAGLLAGLLSSKDRQVRDEARNALLQVLPSIQPEHAGTFSAADMDRLGSALFRMYAASLPLLLRALELVGDRHATPYLRRLIIYAARNPEIAESAGRALAAIHHRQDAEEESRHLLRPVSDAITPADNLLRPAHGVHAIESNQLLRPLGPDS